MIQNASNSITKNILVRTILSENIFMGDKLKIMNDNLNEMLLNEKNKTPSSLKLNIIIDEITKVDEFNKLQKFK